jgi:hypothetical protein
MGMLVFGTRGGRRTQEGPPGSPTSRFPAARTRKLSFAGLQARIQKTSDFLAGIDADALEGADSRTVEIVVPSGSFEMDGTSHLLELVLPNLYFHVTTAYNIVRHNGIEIGKRDYLGMSGS